MSTTGPPLDLEKMALDGERLPSAKFNANMETLNSSTAGLWNGFLTKNVAGSTSPITLTEEEQLNGFIKLTGARTANLVLKVDKDVGFSRGLVIWNATTGAFTVTVVTTAGGSTGIAVTQGKTRFLYHDGTDVLDAITESGASAFGNQTANRVYSGPTSGAAAAPAFRSLVANDLPSNVLAKEVTGLLYDAYGDSLTVGFGATSSFAALLATRNGWTLTNHAVNGSCAWDQGALVFDKTVTATDDQRFSVMLGINDMRKYSTDATKRANFALSLREIIAWLAIPNSKKINGQDTTKIAYTGTWINTTAFGAWGRNSLTVGSTATFTLVGKTIYIASLQQESQNAGFTVTIDGVAKPSTSADGTGMTTYNGATFGPTLYRFDGLSDGPHTVVLTVTGDGAGRTHLLWVASNSGVSFLHGPQVWVGTVTRSTQAFYDANGGSTANVAAYNSEISRIVNQLRIDGLNVTLVDSNGGVDPATQVQADGIHPNDSGQINIADLFEAATNGAPMPPPPSAQVPKGVNVASAAAIAPSGETFHVTGTTNITSMTTTGLIAGSVFTLIFDDVLTFTDGNNIKLTNGNFVTSAEATITLRFDGTDFYEVSRSPGAAVSPGSDNVGYLNIPQNSQSAAYTTVLSDSGKHILHPASDNNARTFTIAANASVAYPIGTAITFINLINTVTIAITSDTLTLMGAGTTGSRTLAANGIATAIKVGTTSWVISGTGLT